MQDPREFYEWLERQPKWRPYGVSACNCPLATWMKEGMGATEAFVHSNGYGVHLGAPPMPLPSWAWAFVRSWDDELGPGERTTEGAIELMRPTVNIVIRTHRLASDPVSSS